MNGYPVVDELEVTIRAGRGVAIIVEGESAAIAITRTR